MTNKQIIIVVVIVVCLLLLCCSGAEITNKTKYKTVNEKGIVFWEDGKIFQYKERPVDYYYWTVQIEETDTLGNTTKHTYYTESPLFNSGSSGGCLVPWWDKCEWPPLIEEDGIYKLEF